eukprot:6008110-Ditylum_brightwellii.AAC.1
MLENFKAEIANASISAVQAAEHEATMKEKGGDFIFDAEGRVGITVSYDTHWQACDSGWSYNSSSDAGYMIGAFTALLIGRK